MKGLLCSLLAVVLVTLAPAQDNPLKKCSVGDWAKYTATTKNETVPMMSSTDQPQWRVAAAVTEDGVRVNGYFMVGEKRATTGGTIHHFKDRYEPVPGIIQSAKVQVVSMTKEKLTIKGKQYDCTKIVRKVDQPVEETAMQSSWVGTSTLWICDAIPLGLVKMENAYHSKLTKDDEGMRIKETWVVADFGFKNWEGE
jgi:hypothetical protein